MRIRGPAIVLGSLLFAVAMAGGAWWYNYQQSRRAAQFWGSEAAEKLVRSPQVALIRLGPEIGHDASATGSADGFDLSGKPGLVHLRHALAYDGNFLWSDARTEPLGRSPWIHALRFGEPPHELLVLFTENFQALGKLHEDGRRVDILPCPRLGPVIETYLDKVGAPISASDPR